MNSSTRHAELVVELCSAVERDGIRLWEQSYSYSAFGSWVLVFGTSKHRTRIVWDGKEALLSLSRADFQNSNSVPEWEAVESVAFGHDTEPGDVFSLAKEKLVERYAT